MASIIKKFMSDNKGKEKYFIDSLNFTQILSSMNNPFIDYETKKTNFNSKEFIEVLNLYKDIYPAICPLDIKKKFNNYNNLLKNGYVIGLNNPQIDSPNFLYISSADNKELFKQGIKIYRTPVWNDGDPSISWPYYLLSINAKCENKVEAFNYIKLLLSDEFSRRQIIMM